MDEEELEQPKNKITLSSFFESIASVEKVANNALSIANSNLNIIQEQKSLIDALSMSIEGLRADIQEVNNYITIQKDETSDKLVETRDDKQKQMISERLQGLQGEKGEKGEKGASNLNESESGRLKNEAEEKEQLEEFVNKVIDEREAKKENERKDELREKEDAEQKKEQSEKLQNKSEGGLQATVGTQGTFDEGGSTGSQGGGEKKKKGLFSLLTNPLALGIGALGAGGALLSLPKMLGASLFGGGMGMGGGRGIGGAADFLTGGLFDFDGRSGGGALKKMGKGLKNMFGGKKKEENVKAEVDNLESRVDALESGDPSSKDSGKIVTTKKLKTRFDRDTGKAYVNGQEVDVQKYAEFKNLPPEEQLARGLDFFKEDNKAEEIKPEKKDRRGIKGIIGGVADSLTGGFFDFDKKGNNKFQDFQQGTADTLTGGVFDFDKKGSNKLQRFQQGFADAMTGNLTDFDRKGGETVGATRTVTGMADFFTGNMFDLDKRGGFDLFGKGKGKDKGFGEKTGSHYGEDGSVYHHYPLDQPRVKNMEEAQEYLKNNPEAKGRPWVKFGDYFVLQTEEQANQDRERLEKAAEGGSKYAQSLLDFDGDNIKPVIESKEKNVSQETLSSIDTSSPQIIVMPNSNQQSTNNNTIAPNNPPQVKVGELKSTSSSSSFVHTISNNVIASAKKNKNLPPQIAAMLK